MARILISESHEAVRRLLERMVTRLGHEPVVLRPADPEFLRDVDLFVVEPAAMLGAVMAKAAQVADPLLPIVCVSVAAPPPIDVAFAACLVKPFTFDQFADAVEAALARRAAQLRAERDDRAA